MVESSHSVSNTSLSSEREVLSRTLTGFTKNSGTFHSHHFRILRSSCMVRCVPYRHTRSPGCPPSLLLMVYCRRRSFWTSCGDTSVVIMWRERLQRSDRSQNPGGMQRRSLPPSHRQRNVIEDNQFHAESRTTPGNNHQKITQKSKANFAPWRSATRSWSGTNICPS